MNLLKQELTAQALQVQAYAEVLDDAFMANLHAAGLRLVHKPDAPKTNAVSLDSRRIMAANLQYQHQYF